MFVGMLVCLCVFVCFCKFAYLLVCLYVCWFVYLLVCCFEDFWFVCLKFSLFQ